MTKKNYIKKYWLLLTVFFVGLVYLLLPGATRIENFPPLSPSTKSNLEGDTIQNPNIAAYFSQFDRSYITKYYQSFFEKTLLVPLPAITLNHPPEEAYQYVRDQQESTFLEEYIYPLRASIYVNGYEPKVENIMHRVKDRSFVGDHIEYKGSYYVSKTTLRFYPSNPLIRIFVYLMMVVLGFYWWKLFKKTLKNQT